MITVGEFIQKLLSRRENVLRVIVTNRWGRQVSSDKIMKTNYRVKCSYCVTESGGAILDSFTDRVFNPPEPIEWDFPFANRVFNLSKPKYRDSPFEK